MRSLEDFSKEELKHWIESDDSMSQIMAKDVLELIDVFMEQGHTGFTAPIAIRTFSRLANYLPISPLTGEDDEWEDRGNGVFQNKRCPQVFKEADGTAYDLDGKIFSEDGEVWYTNKNSKVKITFPYTVPDEPIKIMLVENEDE